MPTLTAEIKDGKICPDTTLGVVAIAKLNGRRVSIEVEIYRKTRSAQQNRYFHGVVCALLAEHCGYDIDGMRAALCEKLLSAADPQTGLKRIKGTSDLNTAEFEEFLDRSRQLGAELGVFIPLPGEYERMIS